jgi:hypothetical protein
MIRIRERAKQSRLKRDEIYDWVCLYADEHHGNSPSLSEIGLAFGIHRQTVYGHILKLIRERRVRYEDNKLVVEYSEWIAPENL